MQKNNSLTTSLLFLVLVSVALFAAFNPKQIKSWLGLVPSEPVLLPTSTCDLAKGPCRYEFGSGNDKKALTLNLQPRPLQAVEPMAVDVLLENAEGLSIGIDFAGKDMNMGFNLIPLTQQTPQHFSGQASLPVCISGKMHWIATLQLETRNQRLHIPFAFEVGE